jgi:hypothetical protein
VTSGWSPTSGWESFEAWKRWYLRVWGRVDEPRQYRPSVPLLGLYRVLSTPEGVQTGVEVAAVEAAVAAAAEREVRRRARAFFVRLQERIAQHGDRRGGVVLQVYFEFEAGPGRWPVWSVGDLAAPPSAPRRSEGELVAAALEDLGG